MITYNNFFENTQVFFKGCKKPNKKPNYVSPTGSKYWYGKDIKGAYVIRKSDHWVFIQNPEEKWQDISKVASCYWHLKTNEKYNDNCGKAYLSQFRKIN